MAVRVLVVDDAAFMRMMIKDILTKNGYEIAGEAENGMKAIEKYNETSPDLVMMDITMPEMDGIQALKKIKEGDPSANVIMCSAMGQQAMVIESIQSGAKDFIVKPFNQDRVLVNCQKRGKQHNLLQLTPWNGGSPIFHPKPPERRGPGGSGWCFLGLGTQQVGNIFEVSFFTLIKMWFSCIILISVLSFSSLKLIS